MTSKELYDTLICKPDLHSLPELYDNVLIWPLYQNAYIQAFCTPDNTSIDVVGNSIFSGTLIHWHPDERDMIDELYALGKKGNMLVLKKTLKGTSTFYIGPPENYPLSDKRPIYLEYYGWKNWDGGQLIYLEQK